jgi:hypothetical protein
VHYSGSIQLTHAGIYQWVSRFSAAPLFEIRSIVSPTNIIECRLKGLGNNLRKMIEYHHEEFPPDKLIQKLIAVLHSHYHCFANTNSTES